ncbi:MAG TPA: AAA family ATPase, partial [Actinomycetota bacterium]|nr:AAA family ATPase [Actinomycetota bacterium]
MDDERQESHASPPSPGSTFIGRQRELNELRAGLQDALSGRGRLILVTGEPGIGKTRLADEVAREADQSGARVLWGRCWERGGAPPYWPWLQVTRACIRELSTETLAPLLGPGAPYLARIIPELRERLRDVEIPEAAETEEARFLLFDAATSFLIELSARQPLAIFLDDLHAADVPSILLLEFLARELRQGSILVVGAYRELEARQRGRPGEILAEAAREGRRISLAGLTEGEVGQFVTEAQGGPAADDLIAKVHDATEGNPLFVGEVARLLSTEGGLPDRETARALPIPETLRQAIRRRLEPLSVRARQAIAVASATISEEFQAAPIQRVSDLLPEDVLQALGECVGAGILEEVPGLPGGFTFSHGVVRETIYDELPTPDRLRLHLAFGTALEEQYRRDPRGNVSEVAYHFFQAAPLGEVEKAVEYAVEAADRASRLYAWENAAAHYERALRALALREPVDERRRCELLLSMGQAQNRAGDVPGARETFLRAAESARTLGAPDLLAAAALGYGRYTLTIGVSDHILVGLLEEALAELGAEESPLRVDVMTRLAIELYYSEDAERRERLSREAVELARKLEDPEALSYAIETSAQATAGPDNVRERLAMGAQILVLAEQVGNRDRRQVAYIYRLPALLELGDIHTFDQEIEAYVRTASELRDPAHLWCAMVHRALRAL